MTTHSHILRKLTALALTLLLCLSTLLPALAEDTMSAELQAAMDREAARMINLLTLNDMYENVD